MTPTEQWGYHNAALWNKGPARVKAVSKPKKTRKKVNSVRQGMTYKLIQNRGQLKKDIMTVPLPIHPRPQLDGMSGSTGQELTLEAPWSF